MRTDGRTDGQTDMTKPVVVFRNFANAPKDETPLTHGLQSMFLVNFLRLKQPCIELTCIGKSVYYEPTRCPVFY